MALEVRNISRSFGSLKGVDDVSLAVESGEIVVVFGPSGSGKTVLLRILAGIHDVDGGAILIDGRDVTDESPEARDVGMAFQNFALFPHLSAFDNVASPLDARRVPPAAIAERVGAIAKLLKIDHVLAHRPAELSNGQKQRTALARALIATPKVLLLDDPLRNVDAKLRYEMRLEFPTLLRKFGSAVLYVTQDYKEAMALADRIALMLNGRIVQLAPPAEIYDEPATVEVARLFGDPGINLLEVEPLAGTDGRAAVAVANRKLDLGPGFAHAIGRPCTLGLRPQDVQLSAAAENGRLPVEILAETPLNEKTVLLTRAANGTEILVSLPSGRAAPAGNGPVYAGFDPAAVHLFEHESGRRIGRRVRSG